MKKLFGQDCHYFIRAYEHAFEKFNRVPEVVHHYNPKAVVKAYLYNPDISEL